MTNILRRFAKAFPLEKGGQNGPEHQPEHRPEPPPAMTGGYRPQRLSKAGMKPKPPTAASGVMQPYQPKGYGRLMRQLSETQQKLVERDVEIAALKVERECLYDKIAALTGSSDGCS